MRKRHTWKVNKEEKLRFTPQPTDHVRTCVFFSVLLNLVLSHLLRHILSSRMANTSDASHCLNIQLLVEKLVLFEDKREKGRV